MKKCKKCKKDIDGTYGSGIFCSIQCANSRTWNKEDKFKKSISAKKSDKAKKANELKKERFIKKCPVCNNNYEIRKCELDRIYCSKECYLKDKEHKYRKVGLGGYREGSGRSLSGYWKNTYCASTYELAFLIWNLDNDIDVKKCTENFEYVYNGKKHLYYPDFVIDDVIYEIKGFFRENDYYKIEAVKSYGRKIVVLVLKDINHMINYVKKKYNTNNLVTVYEDYKPQINTCLNCNKEFEVNKKTKGIYCSRFCAGTHGGKISKLIHVT